MFEQLVRPFQSRQIGTTRRIVPVKVDDTPEDAIITWGSTGQLPQGVVQPKGVNLENIESVGWNLRGSIDNFNQSSRRSEQVDVPINDNAGAQIGTVTLDRATEITMTKKNNDPQSQFGYLPNFGYNQNYPAGPDGKYTPYMPNFTGVDPAPPPPSVSGTPVPTVGLRRTIPSANVSQRTDRYTY